MNFDLFLRSMAIGFSIAAPVGPIGILCIRRSLTAGWLVGLVTGLGAATADAIYGCMAGFGLTMIADFLIDQAIGMKLLGGMFLCYLGLKTGLSHPAPSAPIQSIPSVPTHTRLGLVNAYVSTLFLTLTNPATIMAFMAIFAGLGWVSTGNRAAIGLVGGVFCGSALWWFSLSSSVNLLRRWFTPDRFIWLNRISGLILLVFGIIAISSAVR
ncbi:MAG: LysE family translocator [Elainella sp. Prado103]|jgi:threonine/homoserine/homoserine lactone efflux protein|nr:LysE family translocator [Elainella sp. Prado103]